MTDYNLNGIDDAQENAQQVAEYKSRAVAIKFRQQVSYGTGAAMVFGLVTAVAGKLFGIAFGASATGAATTTAVASSFALPAILGLAVLGVVGVGLLYLSANYLSEGTVLDQTLQAKQISAATHHRAPAVPAIDGKVNNFPAQSALLDEAAPALTEAALPQTTISGERSLADTLVARGAANENIPPTPTNETDAAWTDKPSLTAQAANVQGRG